MLTLKDQTDATGRLLLEDSAPKRAIKNVKRAGIAMKTAPCPYTDTPSRTGGLMNVSAYESLRHDTADVLNGFAWLTNHYLALYPDRRSAVQTLFDVAYVGVTLPLLLFNRRPHPIEPHGALPSYVASLCKASRGVVSASVDLLNRSDRGVPATQAGSPMRQVTAAEVVAFADEQGHLRRPNTERACAAPTRLIERTIHVILTGEGGDGTKSTLGDLVDFPTLWAFCQVQDGFSRSLSQYKALLDDLTASGAAADPNQLFATKVEVNGRTQSFGVLSEALLQHAQATQARLNRILGRGDSPAPVAFEELLRML
jgi:hypothetical protein